MLAFPTLPRITAKKKTRYSSEFSRILARKTMLFRAPAPQTILKARQD
jgi:hypothetical protein